MYYPNQDDHTVRFQHWRNDVTPTFESQNVLLPQDPDEMQEYQKSMYLMEHSVADLALAYVHRNLGDKQASTDKFRRDDGMFSQAKPGVILAFANTCTQRYMDMLNAYINWEIENHIPMVPVDAGQLKSHGFTSEEIIAMQPAAIKYTELADIIMDTLSDQNGQEIGGYSKEAINQFDKLAAILTDQNKSVSRQSFIGLSPEDLKNHFGIDISQAKLQRIQNCFIEFDKMDDVSKKLLKRIHFLMNGIAKVGYQDIFKQLHFVATMETRDAVAHDERLLMELRHRITGDGSTEQNAYGALGSNPTAYLNLLKHGEPNNREAEFRGKMYLIYKLNHFANAVMLSEQKTEHINQWLKKNNKGWSIDNDLVAAMNARGPKNIPPVFRYGANASHTSLLRKNKTNAEMAQNLPNITVKEATLSNVGKYSLNKFFRQKLSTRELMNQTGEWDVNKANTNKPLNFVSGGALFKPATQTLFNVSENTDPSKVAGATQYLESAKRLGLPQIAGISGTLDQGIILAGLVGLGIDQNQDVREAELQAIKLAYLAFMLPANDHSVHEIMQSSKTFGLPYVAGPSYYQYIFPADQAFIASELSNLQNLRGSKLPSAYVKQYEPDTRCQIQH